MTSLHELVHLAATPTDVRTQCMICDRDADPAICGDEGWVCVPCAISDPTRAVVTSPTAEGGLSVWLGDRELASVRLPVRDVLPTAVAAVIALTLGDGQ